MRTPIFELSAICGPIRTEIDSINGATVLTHLQKSSRCGFLLTWPFCFHIWFFWKKQARKKVNFSNNLTNLIYISGDWLPGSERGIYFRTPGYRYDAELGMKWTWGYIGAHWD
jgi:hypothetical protein